jgi:ABC-type antimicrobial peptide transport system permease subunit
MRTLVCERLETTSGSRAGIVRDVGLYGVTADTVEQRTNEAGIRMTLGADRPKVTQLVLLGGFKRVLIGLLLGLPLAVGAGRLISAQLYDVSSWDPLALTVTAGARDLQPAALEAGRLCNFT